MSIIKKFGYRWYDFETQNDIDNATNIYAKPLDQDGFELVMVLSGVKFKRHNPNKEFEESKEGDSIKMLDGNIDYVVDFGDEVIPNENTHLTFPDFNFEKDERYFSVDMDYENNKYSMDDLIKSTCARINYNIELAMKADNESERNRFLTNAKTMSNEISYALQTGNKDVLEDNKDW